MSFKTLIEAFVGEKQIEETSPFEFMDALGKDTPVVVIASEAPAPAIAPEAVQAGGTVLNMPNIPSTKTVQVQEKPDIFKGSLPHLSPEEF